VRTGKLLPLLPGAGLMALLSIPVAVFAQATADAGASVGHAEKTLAVFVVAGLYHSCLGWARKFYQKAHGEDVPIDWTKLRNSLITGLALGVVAWLSVTLGVVTPDPAFYDDHFNFALMFGFATTVILTVHRFMISAPPGSKAAGPRP